MNSSGYIKNQKEVDQNNYKNLTKWVSKLANFVLAMCARCGSGSCSSLAIVFLFCAVHLKFNVSRFHGCAQPGQNFKFVGKNQPFYRQLTAWLKQQTASSMITDFFIDME
jgi:hypothetical protein